MVDFSGHLADISSSDLEYLATSDADAPERIREAIDEYVPEVGENGEIKLTHLWEDLVCVRCLLVWNGLVALRLKTFHLVCMKDIKDDAVSHSV